MLRLSANGLVTIAFGQKINRQSQIDRINDGSTLGILKVNRHKLFAYS